MTRFQIQTLRYVNLCGGAMSARTMGLQKSELARLVAEGFIDFGIDGYSGNKCGISEKGKAFLKSIDADRFAHPEWDDEIFLGFMSRISLHLGRNKNED